MQVKTLIRQTLDTGAAGLGVLRACERRMVGAVTILTYHRVLPDERALAYPLSSLAMPQSMFEQQVQWLAEQCRLLPLSEAIRSLNAPEMHDRPVVCITFDDGYADNAEIAAPTLDRHDARATFFITAGAVRERKVLWHDRAVMAWQQHGSEAGAIAERALNMERATCGARDAREFARWLKQRSPGQRDQALQAVLSNAPHAPNAAPFRLMSIEQVQALHATGHEIASHTLSHALLPQLDDHELERELAGSRSTIAEWTDASPLGIGYPNGDVDDRVVQAAQAAGYSYGCTTAPGRNVPATDRMRLMRIDMNPHRVIGPNGRLSMTAFRGEVCLLHERLRSWKGPTQR